MKCYTCKYEYKTCGIMNETAGYKETMTVKGEKPFIVLDIEGMKSEHTIFACPNCGAVKIRLGDLGNCL